MRWVDLKESLSDFWFEFRREKTGIAGLALLIFWIVVAVSAPYVTEPNIPDKWKTIWIENPKVVPPTWSSIFSGVSEAPHEVIYPEELQKYVQSTTRGLIIDIPYNMKYDVPPQDIVLMNISGKADGRLRPSLTLKIV
ncbi:MAG: peptide/nickel transport system permease protein, partial [Pyrococcus sp.]|nr:peptide/nickel transport system permease protein [Pyrococcus sp.]